MKTPRIDPPHAEDCDSVPVPTPLLRRELVEQQAVYEDPGLELMVWMIVLLPFLFFVWVLCWH